MTLDYGIRGNSIRQPRHESPEASQLSSDKQHTGFGRSRQQPHLTSAYRQSTITSLRAWAPAHRVNDGTVVRRGFNQVTSRSPTTPTLTTTTRSARTTATSRGGSALPPCSPMASRWPPSRRFPSAVHRVTIPSNGIIPANAPALISRYTPPSLPSSETRMQRRGMWLCNDLRSKSLAAARLRGQPRYSHECLAEHQPAQHLRWRQWLMPENSHIYWRSNQSYRCNQRILPRCLLELRRTPGPTHQTLFGWPQCFRIHLGQGTHLRHGRR